MSLATMIEDLINDIGTGLNAGAIRNRLLTLSEQAEALETRLDNCEANVKRLEKNTQAQNLVPKTSVPNEMEVNFLKLLYQHRALTIRQIANSLRIEEGKVEYHKNRLFEAEMIYWAGNRILNDFGDIGDRTLGLDDKGTAYLVENGLV